MPESEDDEFDDDEPDDDELDGDEPEDDELDGLDPSSLREELDDLQVELAGLGRGYLLRWVVRWTIGAVVLTALVHYDARAWWCVAASVPVALLSLLVPALAYRRLARRAAEVADEIPRPSGGPPADPDPGPDPDPDRGR